MSDLEHARLLLNMAHGDLKALHGMLDTAVFTDEVFGFHAQQAVEKCLKAWIASFGLRYPRTHDLMALLDTLQDAEVKEVSSLYPLVDLNIFAVQYRYETVAPDDEKLDRKALLVEIQSLFDHVAGVFC